MVRTLSPITPTSLLPKNPTPPKFTNSATGFQNLPPMDPTTPADAVPPKPSSESTPPPNPDRTLPPKPSSESIPPPPNPDPTLPPKPSSESTPSPPNPDPNVPPKPSSESTPPPPNPDPNVPSPATDRAGAEKMETLKTDPVAATEMPTESNPYVAPSPAATPASSKVTMEKVKSMLGRWGKKVGETAKRTEVLAGNTWQHLRTGPSFADAAMGRIAQGTKVLAEGGYEKIFRNTFEALPEEQLKKTFACYLSTSAGPVMGVLYLSTAKLAFCSDNPLSYKNGETTEWTYYKVVIPLNQLRTVCPSASEVNVAEKYIQVVSVDNHEFWFLGFVNYDSAVKNLQEALVDRKMPSAPILP